MDCLKFDQLDPILLSLQQSQTLPAIALQAPLPFSIHCFDRIPSTNQAVWDLVDQGAGMGTVAIAREQTAGRGQWGRQWLSVEGGLYLSLAITPDCLVEESAQLTLSSAWGIATVFQTYGVGVGVKWPNDLVLERRKLGGILTETRIGQGRIRQAVVGVGINWSNSVPDTGIALKSYWDKIDRNETDKNKNPATNDGDIPQANLPLDSLPLDLTLVAALTLHGLALGYQCWQQQGIGTILPTYLALLTNLGQPLTWRGHQGRIVGVTPQGKLRVQLEAPVHWDTDLGDTDLETYLDVPTDGTLSSIREVLLEPGEIRLGYGDIIERP